ARFNEEDVLKKSVEGLATEVNGTVVRETPKTIDNFPAREVVYSTQDGAHFHCLIVLTKTRAFVAAAGGPFVSAGGNKRIRRFLDSFHVVAPDKGNPWRNAGQAKDNP